MSILRFSTGLTQNCGFSCNAKNMVDIQLNKTISENILCGGLIEVLNEHNESVMGFYEGFTTIYRKFENEPLHYQLSNDGSVWVEPEISVQFSAGFGGTLEGETKQIVDGYSELVTPTPIANENYQFVKWNPEIPELGEITSNTTFMAEFEYVETLEEVLGKKVKELSDICNSNIIAGVSIEINGVEEHFSYGITTGDQSNIDDLFNLANTTKLDQSYHCDGGNCKLYSVEDIIKLYVAQKMNKAHHLTYHNQLKSYVCSIDDKDVVTAISYGDVLTGIYLEKYNETMEHEKLVLNAVLNGLGYQDAIISNIL